jgi:hypothetical protein
MNDLSMIHVADCHLQRCTSDKWKLKFLRPTWGQNSWVQAALVNTHLLGTQKLKLYQVAPENSVSKGSISIFLFKEREEPQKTDCNVEN